jgi:small GTP-binding protein
MGGSFTKLFDSLSGKTKANVLMLGLDAAGKTTILYQMRLGEVVTTMPTIGFNVEEVKYKNVTFSVFDIGGQDKIRKLWKYYYDKGDAIIFVVDASDRERVPLAKKEIETLMTEPALTDASLLVYANKQDLPNALSGGQLAKELGLQNLRRSWFVQTACAKNGDGIIEGLDWVVRALKNKRT